MQTLRLRAIIYPEDGLWVAHALEMDLIGTGASEAATLRELRSNVEAQLSFAKHEKINPFHPAPVEIQKPPSHFLLAWFNRYVMKSASSAEFVGEM